MLFGLVVGLPAAIIAGPVYGRFITPYVPAGVPAYMTAATNADRHTDQNAAAARPLPAARLIVALIGLPLLLIVGNTVAGILLDEGNTWRASFAFAGHPMVALLVTSAGGVLKQILIDSGVGAIFADRLLAAQLSPLLLAFAIAAAVRFMQGSATVAMLTAGGLVAALVGDSSAPATQASQLVIAIAAGATCASHVNDSGFWLVNRYLGLSVPDTLKTWTAATTIIAIVALLLTLVLSALLA
jgi:Gnt-I system low-affinity gluconate transporter